MKPRASLPDHIDDAIDDIAFVYRWPLSEIMALSPEDLSIWWQRARRRLEDSRG